MGIIKYFKYVAQTYPQVIHRKQPPPQKINTLFYDANGLIYKNIPKCKTENEIYMAFCEEIVKQNNFIKPDQVYIILDGIPCYAKLQQQRKRRFMSQFKNQQLFAYCKKNLQLDEYEKNNWFDTNQISVGTKFMKNLSIYVNNFIIENNLTDYITFLDDQCPGEAEHKIFQIIKKDDPNTEKTYAINGLDSDLIQLVLFNIDKYNVCIVREDQTFIDTKLLADLIIKDIEEKYTLEITLQEYVVLTMLFGNDFLPRLSFLHFNDDVYDYLYKTYEQCCVETNVRIIVEKTGSRSRSGSICSSPYYEINYLFLKNFFRLLMIEENVRYQRYLDEFYDSHNRMFSDKVRYNYNTYEDFLKVLDMFPQKIIKNDNVPVSKIQNKYDLYYYVEGMNLQEQQKIKQMCFKYISGLQYNLDYYQYNETQSNYCYEYQIAPFIQCLYNNLCDNYDYIKTIVKQNTIYTVNIDNDILQLFIMPFKSRDLVDKKYHGIYYNLKYNVAQYYPVQFNINTFLKTYLHECEPKIPHLDINKIIKVKKRITNEQYENVLLGITQPIDQ